MIDRFIVKATFSTVLAIILCVNVFGQKGRTEIAKINNDGSSVSWRVLVPHKSVTLTVSTPDGSVLRREFEAGTTPVFLLTNAKGEHYGDGAFKYELVITPILSPSVRQEMAAARESGNSEEVEANLRKRGLLPAAARESGRFSLVNGQLFTKNDPGTEPADINKATAKTSDAGDIPTDNVVLTTSDGVIRNSLCVGFDCPNGPTFGDSTILMMENNTRIKFGDTSSAASFPRNDWEIEANSNLNGGANYIGFNDCGEGDNDGGCATDLVFAVEAGARQSALYVESDGDVGFGTSNPVLDLHIVSGDTPSIRLDQDGSSGFAPQVWDVAGNETNFFIRDATNGSALPFRIEPGTPSNAIYVDSTGDIGFNDTSPDADLDIRRSGGRVSIEMEDSSSGDAWQLIMDDDADANAGLSFTRAGTGVRELRITPTGDVRASGNFFSNGVQLNVPDYVFEPDYKLMSLDEVAEYIRKHKRLPNVQSAADVKENGLNITGLSLRLLEKVEELTLYTIGQQKLLDAQQKALDAREHEAKQMKAEIEALKKALVVSP